LYWGEGGRQRRLGREGRGKAYETRVESSVARDFRRLRPRLDLRVIEIRNNGAFVEDGLEFILFMLYIIKVSCLRDDEAEIFASLARLLVTRKCGVASRRGSIRVVVMLRNCS
jgi:hypothetical protein